MIYHVKLATSCCVLYRLFTCVLNTTSTLVHIPAMRPNPPLPLVCLILAHISSLPDFPPTYLNWCISVHGQHEFCAVATMLILILYTFICLHPDREWVFSSLSFCTSSSLDVPAGATQEEGHTGFLIRLLSAVRALIFLARDCLQRVQNVPRPSYSTIYTHLPFTTVGIAQYLQHLY